MLSSYSQRFSSPSKFGDANNNDNILMYADDHFNPEADARNLFATESTNIDHRIDIYKDLEAQADAILRKRVHDNYQMFLKANEEISKVGKDMIELKQLVESTQDLINKVKDNRIADIKGAKTSVATSERVSALDRPVSMSTKNTNDAAANKLPTWFAQAPEDLERLIIEQQFSAATALVAKVRSYIENTKSMLSSGSVGTAMSDIRRQVEESAHKLAKIIKQSLKNMPSGQLWGQEEQLRRLQLLVALGHQRVAAETFSKCQPDLTQKAFSSVEASGDSLDYISDLVQSFFSMLREKVITFQTLVSCDSFALELSTRWKDNVQLLASLVKWVEDQLRTFIGVVCRQIQIGFNEHSAVTIAHLRSCLNHRQRHNNNPKKGGDALDIIDSPQKDLEELSRVAVAMPALMFLCDCVRVILDGCRVLPDVLWKNCSSICRVLLIPEINRFLGLYTSELTRELTAQVHQDSWTAIIPSDLVISDGSRAKPKATTDNNTNNINNGVGSCYHWVINMFNILFDECDSLLRLRGSEISPGSGDGSNTNTNSNNTNTNSTNSVSNSTAEAMDSVDFNEVQISIAIHVLRLCLRFSMDLCAVDYSLLSEPQRRCWRHTVQVTRDSLLQSFDVRFWRLSVTDSIMNPSPSNIIRSIRAKFDTVLEDSQGANVEH